MRAWVFAPLLLAFAANAHSIFQRLSVNGADQGYLVGVRAPDSDYPIQNTGDGNMACNTGFHNPISSTVISVPAGAKLGALWGHVLGGAQFANDQDNPIARSHKGPIQAYLAKVNNAATTSTNGLKWFKIASDGLSGTTWGVDRMIANNGWSYFTLPSCIAPGHYLLRVELIALHGAQNSGGAQFYMSCAQINVTGGGSFTPSNTVSFPGAYRANDPGILVNIYDNKGNPTNGGRTYTAPGPAVISCSDSSSGNDSAGSSSGGGTESSPGSTGGSGSGAALYAQCGGVNWTGPTSCASGKCTISSEHYSQCIP